ncbi:MAG: DUF927 domain-containing protein [Desulfurobacteriaceae bacterium]
MIAVKREKRREREEWKRRKKNDPVNLPIRLSLQSLECQEFSERSINDLAESGLILETVERMGILPLTPENFKQYIHRSLIEKQTRSPIITDGYIIPYQHLPVKYGRVKVLEWNEGSVYYQENKDSLPKYLQPSKQHLEETVHLYYLKDVEGKISSPKSVFVITEGEKKTAKLQQELEKLETEYRKYVAVGLGGVNNWNENTFRKLSLKDKTIFIAFDADGIYNVNVAKAELKLYSYLLSKGVVKVKSLVWSVEEGKGIDDYLVKKEKEGVSPEKALEKLMEKAVSPLMKYTKKEGKKLEGLLSFESVLECFAKHLTELPLEVVEEIKKIYKRGKREIEKEFKRLVSEKRRELEEKLKKEEQEEFLRIYENLFGIGFIPTIPKGYEKNNGLLLCNGESICEFFVVTKVRENADEIDGGYIATLSFISGKKIEIEYSVISFHKLLCKFLNKKGIQVSESEAKKIQNYITKFIRLNKNNIFSSPYSSRLGWGKIDGEEVYVHPSTCTIDVFISPDIKEKLIRQGSREKEIEVIKNIIKQYPHAGLVWVMGVTTSVLQPLLKNDYNLVIMLQGESRSGKTTAIKSVVSFYAHPELKRSFNFTEGGFEAFVSRFKDFPIHLEEIRDLDGNPQKRVEKFLNFVYSFVGGDSRVRMNIDLTLRKAEKYRGVIFTSSEIGIDEILSYSSDNYREGLKGRLLVFPVEKKKFGGDKLARLVEDLYENYGNLLPLWIEHFERNKERIIKAFKERELDFREGYSKLDSKFVRFLAAVSVVMEEVGRLFGIDTTELWTALEEVGSFNEEVYSGEENLKEKIERIIKGFSKETLVEEEDIHGRVIKTVKEYKGDFLVYRRVQKEKDMGVEKIIKEENYLTPKRLDKLTEIFGVSRKILIKRLIEAGIMEKDTSSKRLCKRIPKTILYESTRMQLYPIHLDFLSELETEEERELVDEIDI